MTKIGRGYFSDRMVPPTVCSVHGEFSTDFSSLFYLYTRYSLPFLGVPLTYSSQNGWFIMENPIKMGWFGGTTIFGNSHICPSVNFFQTPWGHWGLGCTSRKPWNALAKWRPQRNWKNSRKNGEKDREHCKTKRNCCFFKFCTAMIYSKYVCIYIHIFIIYKYTNCICLVSILW